MNKKSDFYGLVNGALESLKRAEQNFHELYDSGEIRLKKEEIARLDGYVTEIGGLVTSILQTRTKFSEICNK